MVHLTRIYTRTGDSGQTRLVDMSLTDKTDPRVAAYGDVDEANSQLGVALATGELTGLIADLVAALGGEAAPGLPSGFTDAPAPLDVAHDEATASADDPPF